MSGRLHLGAGPDGPQHYLEDPRGRGRLRAGLRLSAGRWLRCQYRWNGDEDSLPVFSVVLGGGWEQRLLSEPSALNGAPEGILRMELDDAEFRWPELT